MARSAPAAWRPASCRARTRAAGAAGRARSTPSGGSGRTRRGPAGIGPSVHETPNPCNCAPPPSFRRLPPAGIGAAASGERPSRTPARRGREGRGDASPTPPPARRVPAIRRRNGTGRPERAGAEEPEYRHRRDADDHGDGRGDRRQGHALQRQHVHDRGGRAGGERPETGGAAMGSSVVLVRGPTPARVPRR